MIKSPVESLETTDLFFGPFLKVDRAYQHIAQLETIFGVFLATNQNLLAGEPHHDVGKETVLGQGFPIHTAAVLGDAIHNLRAALDHAYCILIEQNSQVVDDGTYFPFLKDGKGLKGTIYGGKKPKPVPNSKIIRCIVEDIQPYTGGKLSLYDLHLLDRTDKHRVLIPTALTMTVGVLEITTAAGKVITWEGGTFVADHGKPHTSGFFSAPGGTIKDKGDTQTSFDISFGEGQPCQGEAVIPKLHDLGLSVIAALKLLETRM